MPPNRIVALFTPVIALGAASAAAWLAELGLDVSATELEAVFVAGLAAVLAPAAQWLHGAQKHERYQAELDQQALAADTTAAQQTAEAAITPADSSDDDDGYYEDDDGYEYGDDDDGDPDDDYEAAREEQPASA